MVRYLLIMLCMLGMSEGAAAMSVFHGKVIAVEAGDTLLVAVDNRRVRVKLAGIVTPGIHQVYGMNAKKTLGNLVFGREVKVETRDAQVQGAQLAKVYIDGRSVSAVLLREGSAWVDRNSYMDGDLMAIEETARYERRGMWASAVRAGP